MYRMRNIRSNYSHKEFRIEFSKSLYENYKLKESFELNEISFQKQYWFDYIPEKKKRICHECKTSKTIWMCKKCSKKMYPSFEKFHSK